MSTIGSSCPRRRYVLAVALALGIGFGGWSSGLLANGIVRDSLGAVPSGRGNANVAHSDNLSLIHDNPAGLGWMESGFRLEISGDFLYRDVSYRDPMTSGSSDDGVFVLPHIAAAARFDELPVTFGLGIFLPGGYGVDYRLDHPTLGRQDYESAGLLLKILPSFAWQIGEKVSIGGGIGVGYGSNKIKMPYTFQTGPLAGGEALIDLDADGFAVTGNFGIQYRPIDGLTIGAAFISETVTDQDGDFDLDVTGGLLDPFVVDNTASYDVDYKFRWPRSVSGGATYRFGVGRVSLDAVWYDWSSALDDFRFTLSNGDNPEFDALAGPTPSDTFPLDWRDSVSIRLGYEHFFESEMILRAGYTYNVNPIPDRTLTPMLPGILEHAFSVGLGQSFGMAQIDFAYQYTFSGKREVGTSDVIGGDFDNSRIRAEAHWAFVTLGMRF